MKSLIFAATGLVLSSSAMADQVADQIRAVKQIQDQQEVNRQNALKAQQAADEAEFDRENKQRQADAELAAKQEADRIRRANFAAQEAETAKRHDQDYMEKLRALEIDERELRLQEEKARLARENDFIDQELNAQAAKTDVIKSQADANRNVSAGTKTLLEKTGQAEVEKESGIFGK